MSRSAADGGLKVCWISLTLDRDRGRGALDLCKVIDSQFDVGRPEVLLQAMQLRRAGIGTIQGFSSSSQASAICAGVAFFSPAMRFSKSTST